MAKEELVRFGILGAGSIALFRHALELSQNPYAKLVAVYDPIKSRAEYLSSLRLSSTTRTSTPSASARPTASMPA